MPFKSVAQRAKFGALLAAGEITQETFDEWNAETPKHIPERLHPKKAKPAATQRRTKHPGRGRHV